MKKIKGMIIEPGFFVVDYLVSNNKKNPKGKRKTEEQYDALFKKLSSTVIAG